jgi:fructuronate reductase
MKLRLLNGSHSALAYVSYLKGHRGVDDAMADPAVRGFVASYMEEVTPTVPEVPGVDLAAYKAKLLERFSNRQLSDQVSRLCEDGSKKINVFVAPCVAHKLEEHHHHAGEGMAHLSVACAGWIQYMAGVTEAGEAIEVLDPRAGELQPLAKAALASSDCDARAFFAAALDSNKAVAASEEWCNAVQASLKQMRDTGVDATLASL